MVIKYHFLSFDLRFALFDLRLLSSCFLLDTRTWPEGKRVLWKRGCPLFVRLPYSLFVLPSGRKFSQERLIWFFWSLVWCQEPIFSNMWQSRIFLKKMMSKMVKKGQKTRFFGLFKKIKSLVLSGIVVERKCLWSFNILQKLHTWEKSGSQVIMAKNGSRSVRVRYLLIINISLIDWYLTLIFGM